LNTSYIGTRNDPSGLGLIADNVSDWININPFSFIQSKAKIQKAKFKELFACCWIKIRKV